EAASIEVRADTSAARAEILSLEAPIGRIARLLKTAFIASFVGGVAALALAFGGSVTSAANFEQQLSNLQAVSDTTGAQLDKLREQALQAGADTAFSAKEAAEAQTELVKAGASVEQTLG